MSAHLRSYPVTIFFGERNEADHAEADGASRLKKTRLRAQGGSDVGEDANMSQDFQGSRMRSCHNHIA
jgi:hypothetical protein